MAVSVVMPALEMAQETGKVISWRKREGEQVVKGEPLLEVETDKAVVEVESPGDGILSAVSAREGAVIPVGQTIAWLLAPGEAPPLATAPAQTGRRTDTAGAGPGAASSGVSNPPPSPPPEMRISPKARRLAREHGVDVTRLRGSGPGGEILAEDIMNAAKSAGAAAAPAAIASAQTKSQASAGEIEPLGTVGRLMAARTTQSWTTVPHFFVTRDVDATALNAYRERAAVEIEREHQLRVTHTDLLIALVSRVLLKHPRLNASWSAEGIRLHSHVNMGVAIAVNDGVVAAVIPNAHATTVSEIAIQRRDVAERARAGKLRPADIADATFTISNLGMYQVDQFSAIITPPQAAILAVGSIADRVVALQGKAVVRSMMNLTLSCDHRVVYGADGARFLSRLRELLQAPLALTL